MAEITADATAVALPPVTGELELPPPLTGLLEEEEEDE